ncbi:hypothetical protein TIFTF001_023779 [Ficus carica]|uniref:Uncharacterized protein n=1 Tax=Ficus carica TaxID=3494 RepID=A0AA88AFE4_FICCA|nr:hypothetical protein TIFTF001_023779 [Ficus carica]
MGEGAATEKKVGGGGQTQMAATGGSKTQTCGGIQNLDRDDRRKGSDPRSRPSAGGSRTQITRDGHHAVGEVGRRKKGRERGRETAFGSDSDVGVRSVGGGVGEGGERGLLLLNF